MRLIRHGDKCLAISYPYLPPVGVEHIITNRVLNPEEPVNAWQLSTRPLKALDQYPVHAFLPQSAEEAWALLVSLPAVFITWNDLAWNSATNWKQGVWFNRALLNALPYKYDLFESWMAQEVRVTSFYLGNSAIWDGGKLVSIVKDALRKSQRDVPIPPEWVVLDRAWISLWQQSHQDLGVEFWPIEKRRNAAV